MEPTIDNDKVRERAATLRAFANIFEHRDWAWSRDHGIRHIRMKGDWSGYDHPLRRVRRWLDDYARIVPELRAGRLRRRPKTWVDEAGLRIAWRHPIIHARVSLGSERHLPDGHLDGGAVIVHWEETGEYLVLVQPSVGSLLADWMEAEPDNPHARRIAAEMTRLAPRYSAG